MGKRFLFLLLLLTFGVFVCSKIAIAGSNSDLKLPEQRINPGKITYPVKRLWEKLRIKTISKHEAKVEYYEILIEKRLSELGHVAKTKNIGQTQKASERFSYFSGTLTEYLIGEEGADEDKKRLKEKFESYKQPLEELRDEFPANSSDWMMISYCIDSLEEYSSKLAD